MIKLRSLKRRPRVSAFVQDEHVILEEVSVNTQVEEAHFQATNRKEAIKTCLAPYTKDGYLNMEEVRL